MNDYSLFVRQQNSEATQTTYARAIERFLAFLDGRSYDTVTDAEVVAWKQALAESNLAEKSQATYWSAVASFYDWLVKTGRMALSPFAVVKGPRVLKNRAPRIPTVEQFEQIMAEFERGPLLDNAVAHCLASGLRESEVVTLGTDDLIYLSEYKVWVLRVVGKGHKERMVPIAPESSDAIFRWIGGKPESRALFCNPNGSPLTRRQVQCVIERVTKRLSIKGISAHSLRHHFATKLARSGVDVFTIQKLLGHASLTSTQVYVNLDLRDVVAAVKRDPKQRGTTE